MTSERKPLIIRFTEQEKAKLVRVAKKLGLSLAATVRWLLREAK